LKIRKASTAYPENSEKKKPSKHLSKKNVQNIQENSKETLAQSTTSLHIIAKKKIIPNKSKSFHLFF
jgi:hypothetical protein